MKDQAKTNQQLDKQVEALQNKWASRGLETERLRVENKILRDHLWSETWLLTEQLCKAVTVNWLDGNVQEKHYPGEDGEIEFSVLQGSLQRGPVRPKHIDEMLAKELSRWKR